MKKFVACALVFVLCFVYGVSLATDAQYSNTKYFVSLLDDEDISYTVIGVDDGNEQISIKNRDDDINKSYTINVFFKDDEEHVSVRIWNLVDFNKALVQTAYGLCNTLNAKWKYACFYVDEDDYSITVSYDMIVPNSSASSDLVLEAIVRLVKIIGDGYETLEPLE